MNNEIIYSPLTEREKEIIKLIAKGFSTKMIADTLFISYETVKSHRRNIISKLNASNIAEAIYISVKYALIE